MTNEYPQPNFEENSVLRLIKPELDRIRNYSPDKLLSLGKNLLMNFEYIKARTAFNELKRFGKFEEISGLYLKLSDTLFTSGVETIFGSPKRIFLDGKEKVPSQINSKTIDNAIFCMIESSNMYAEKKLSKENFSDIEYLIDQIPFPELTFSGREEFNRIYNNFKEYATDVFHGIK